MFEKKKKRIKFSILFAVLSICGFLFVSYIYLFHNPKLELLSSKTISYSGFKAQVFSRSSKIDFIEIYLSKDGAQLFKIYEYTVLDKAKDIVIVCAIYKTAAAVFGTVFGMAKKTNSTGYIARSINAFAYLTIADELARKLPLNSDDTNKKEALSQRALLLATATFVSPIVAVAALYIHKPQGSEVAEAPPVAAGA